MKILFLQCFDSPHGQSNRSFLYARYLSKLGNEVTFYSNKYNHLDGQKIKNKNLTNCQKEPRLILADNKKFYKNRFLSTVYNFIYILKLNIKNFDIIIGPSVPLVNSFLGLLFAKINKKKFFYEIRDVWPDALVYNKALSRLNPLYYFLKLLEIWIYKYSDGVISALPNFKKYLNYYSPKKPLIYLPNSFKINKKPFIKRFNKNKIEAVYIGRHNLDHDVKTILKVAERVQEKFTKLKIIFNIYGYGQNYYYHKQLAKNLKLKNVKFLGQIEKNKIQKTLNYYDIAFCTVTNSKGYQWGLNLNKSYEYLRSGTPTIISSPCKKNLVSLSHSGYSHKPYDYKSITKSLIHFYYLTIKEKRYMSIKAVNYFNNNYDIKKLSKEYNKFLKMNS